VDEYLVKKNKIVDEYEYMHNLFLLLLFLFTLYLLYI